MRRLEAALWVLLIVFVATLLAPAVVAVQPSFGYAAVVYLVVCILLLLAAAGVAVWLTWRTPSRERVALEIEAGLSELGSNLISSLQLFPRKGRFGPDDPTSPALIDALVSGTAEQVKSLEPRAFAPDSGPRRMGWIAGALGAAVLLLALFSPNLYPRTAYLLTHAVELMPSRITHLSLSASAAHVLRGMPVDFIVQAEGMRPEQVELEIHSLGTEGSPASVDRLAMASVKDRRFRITWKGGSRDVRVVARTGRFASMPFDVRVVEAPQVTAIEVVAFPPEYTGLGPVRGQEGGSIRAYLGSSVLVRAKANKSVSEANLALADGWRLPLKMGEEGFLEGILLVGSAGSYQIRLKDIYGFANLAPPRYRIDILPDTLPEVEVLLPGKDVTVEVGEEVNVRFRAEDDFGVKVVTLEYRAGKGGARRLRLWGGEAPLKRVTGGHQFDLRALGLRPGATLSYRVLVEDTDTVSGPKRNASRTYRIKIRDREEVMAGLDQRLRKISEGLLDLLGDNLEKNVDLPEGPEKAEQKAGRRSGQPGKSMRKKADGLLEEVRRARGMLRPQNPREALASVDLDALRDRLRDAMNRFLTPPKSPLRGGEPSQREMKRREETLASRQEEATQAFERLASMGEDLLRNLRVDRAGRMTDSMLQRQQALMRELEKMRKSGADDETTRRIEKEMARLQREMGQLMRQLANLAQRLPSEFLNQRGLRDLPAQNMMKAFDQIRQMMQKGNMRGALERMRQLMNQMRRLRSALRGMMRRRMMTQRRGRPMQQRQGELAKIVQEQEAILTETINLRDSLVERMKKRNEKGLLKHSSGIMRLLEKEQGLSACPPTQGELAALEKKRELEKSGGSGIPAPGNQAAEPAPDPAEVLVAKKEMARINALEALREMAERGEWAKLHDQLPGLLKAMGRETCAGKNDVAQNREWKTHRDSLGQMLRKEERRTPPPEQTALRGLQDRQDELGKRLSSFEAMIRRMMQIFPFIDPSILRRIVQAGKEMTDATASLGRVSAPGAVPHQEEAIRQLSQGQNAMQQAMQQMAQRGSLGMGTPRGWGFTRRGGPGWWQRNPNLPPQRDARRPGNNEEEDGRLGSQFSEVLIPGREQYRAPKEFREEVMEALKEGLPETLRGEIEDYFDRLTK